ncbi:MAG: energy transducer TonB [Phascolarctobacterium sp.]|nr:energy transducer TonB [Phascolarctobacterium sp.]
MNMQKRQRIGMLGSLVTHVLIFLLVAFSGMFNITHAKKEDIVEISMFGGGGGGGGQGDGSDQSLDAAVENESTAAEASKAVEQLPQPSTDDIYQGDKKEQQTSAAAQKRAYPKKGSGSGGGFGSGHGTGTGSGYGPGSGSGSGGGIGSGHGTGIGSGYGAGSGKYAAPAVPPRLIRNPYPMYPDAERKAGIQGTTVLNLLVGKDGKIEEITILSSSGNANLDQAAISACFKWRFTGARNKAGQPVRCYMSVPLTFRIK